MDCEKTGQRMAKLVGGGDMPHGEQDVPIRLLMAATELFHRKGYAAASVSDIVAAAGVSKSVLYYYFQSKEGIFKALFELALEAHRNLVREAESDTGTARERIVLFCERQIRMFVEHLPVARLFYALYFGPPQSAPEFHVEEFHTEIIGRLRTLVMEGVENGELETEDPEALVWVILSVVDTVQESYLARTPCGLDMSYFPRMLHVIFNGCRPQSTEPARS